LMISCIGGARPTCGLVYRGSSQKSPGTRRIRYESSGRRGDRSGAHHRLGTDPHHDLGQAFEPSAGGFSCHLGRLDRSFLDNTERPSVDDRAACVAIRVHGASLRRSDRGRESRRVELDPTVPGRQMMWLRRTVTPGRPRMPAARELGVVESLRFSGLDARRARGVRAGARRARQPAGSTVRAARAPR